jgi:hypothetical protein
MGRVLFLLLPEASEAHIRLGFHHYKPERVDYLRLYCGNNFEPYSLSLLRLPHSTFHAMCLRFHRHDVVDLRDHLNLKDLDGDFPHLSVCRNNNIDNNSTVSTELLPKQ